MSTPGLLTRMRNLFAMSDDRRKETRDEAVLELSRLRKIERAADRMCAWFQGYCNGKDYQKQPCRQEREILNEYLAAKEVAARNPTNAKGDAHAGEKGAANGK